MNDEVDDDFVTPDERMIASLQREAPDIGPRIEYVRTADEQTIAQITVGILFVHAIWSGTALLSLRKLNQVINRLDKQRLLRIVATNTETCDHLQLIPELRGRLHGHGEIAWIYNGAIVSTYWRDDSHKAIDQNTADLLIQITDA